MKVELSEKMSSHFKRLESLAEEAETDVEERYSSRASAMSALTSMLKELEKSQAKIYNMERLSHIEAETISTLKEFLTPEQHNKFLERLSERLQDNSILMDEGQEIINE